MRFIKKTIWFIHAIYSEIVYPIDNSLPYLGVTGTDGKTTTCMFLYEIAKAHGYKPLVITTVGVIFNDKYENIDLKSTSFLSFSIKHAFYSLKKLDILNFLKNLFLLNKEDYEKNNETHRTTPLASEIRKTIRKYTQKGANLIILECTSHALDQFRVHGIYFDSIVFTNITNEHLDYHGNWLNYANTKSKLIKQLKSSGTVSINYNDTKSYEFLEQKIKNLKQQKIIYWVKDFESINPKKFFVEIKQKTNAEDIEIIASPYKAKYAYIATLNILGDYNVYNAMAAFSCFYGFNNQNIDKILEGIKNLLHVPGRMEIVNEKPKVIIDFAHTTNGMENALKSIRNNMKKGKLWVIFGCAGERYKEKRPEMGKVAFTYADRIIVTTEDPRKENPIEINNQIISGIKEAINKYDENKSATILTYHKDIKYDESIPKLIVRFDSKSIENRKNSIKFALKNAKPEDVIVILGKGHETTFAIDDTEYKWNDIEITKKLIHIQKNKKS